MKKIILLLLLSHYSFSQITQIGLDIDGEAADDESGFSVSLSSDGTIVAIGARLNDDNGENSGHVRVYEWNNTSWNQLGGVIEGEAAIDESGFSVSLSSDGSVVAIGARSNGDNGNYSGHVRVYEWNNTSWTQLGGDIDAENDFDNSGSSVSLSSDGTIVAIGARGNDGSNGNNSGHVRVYEWDNTSWTQLGGDIDGEAAEDFSGYSVSLSSDGSIVAIGAARSGNDRAGHVRVYEWNNTSWTQIDSDIDGEGAGDYSGHSVSLSSDGSVVAIGAPYNNDGSGHVRVYQIPVDTDGDGVPNNEDNCPLTANTDQLDTDGDQIGDVCDTDDDGDGVMDTLDNCPLIANTDQLDSDQDGIGNVCDTKGVSDGVITQIGDDINGEAAGDYSGQSVSLSSDGTVIAIGAGDNEGNGVNSGHVRVYEWDNSSWTQLGGDIDGEAANDFSGESVSLSSDGSVVAIGARLNDDNGENSGHVRVYEWDNTSWTQIGDDIDGEAAGDQSGYSVSLSSDGSIVAIGGYLNGDYGLLAGHVRVYQWDNTSWTQLGDDIDGEATYDYSGTSVSLSSDGSIVAIGARFNDGSANNSGHVRVYEWNNSSWTQLGGDIDGEAALDQSGSSVSLSSDGSVVAIGARLNDDNGVNSGHVRVYEWDNSSWTQLGGDIDGEAANDFSGESVSLSSDGSVVAIGAHYNDGNGEDAGHVRVYEWDNTSWTQIGDDIDGEAADDWSGFSVSLSSDGSIVAIGGYLNDDNGDRSGHVRVYQIPFDTDGDGVLDPEDNCPLTANTDQLDSDEDGIGDVCDTDDDGDGVLDTLDNCLLTANTDQLDSDGDQIGDVCDNWDDRNGVITQIGDDINGEAAGDFSGSSVSISMDGSIVAIGATTNHNDNGRASGHVRVYEWDNTSWTQLGDDIDGENFADFSGWSVSLSSDGSIVAIGSRNNDDNGSNSGHVRVYEWDNSSWTQLGGDIDGEAAGDVSGNSVSLSSDGSVVAIGAPGNDGNGDGSGHVRVYEWNNTSWTQRGGGPQDIDGEAAYDESGYSVSLSSDGSIVAIGARSNDGNGNNSGHVRVYEWNNTSWTQLGGDIDGEAAGDQSGHSVSLSSDGSVVAIGGWYNDANGNDAGHVRVYKWDNTSWTQLGGDMDGEAAGDESGYSVSLSSDGSIVAIGARYNDGNGNKSGHVRMYKWDNSSWTQIDSDIDGEAAGDESGNSVSLSSDGSVVAIGATSNFQNGINSGHVRVYQIPVDTDGDGVLDSLDNCPLIANTDQLDTDEDGIGDVCDLDDDGDGVLDTLDNCPLTANTDQLDTDEDGIGDICDADDDGDGVLDSEDNCPLTANTDQLDTDEDGIGDVCDLDNDGDGVLDTLDNCPLTANTDQLDTDEDGIGDVCDMDTDGDGVLDTLDNCPLTANTDQLDTDEDGIGDICDADDDGDGVLDSLDNCPLIANTDQLDTDEDGIGDVCDMDTDGDGVLDTLDNCPLTANTDQLDTDEDGIGDVCDKDDDGDGVLDTLDNCPLTANTDQLDTDEDGIGDICDADDDGDGVLDSLDNCPLIANTDQLDTDEDGIGDVCDLDNDGDGVLDTLDNCPLTANTDQLDTDEDGIGDICDADDDGDGVEDSIDNCPLIANPDQEDWNNNGVGDACGDPKPLSAENITFVENIYPNPTDDKLTVSIRPGIKIKDLYFVDFNGKTIKPKSINRTQDNLDINVSNLNDGVYILEIVSGKEVDKVKVIIER